MLLPDGSRRLFLRGRFTSAPVSALRPPWAVEEKSFSELCTRCNDCINACPECILARGDGGYPEIRFQRGECTFCEECVNQCEPGALQFPANAETPEQRKQQAWTLSVNFTSVCLALNSVVCRACGDACETRAIHFQLKPGGIADPCISLENCTGCGACVSVCPVDAVLVQPATTENIAA